MDNGGGNNDASSTGNGGHSTTIPERQSNRESGAMVVDLMNSNNSKKIKIINLYEPPGNSYVSDPVSCIYTHSSTGTVAIGTVAGSVRLYFPIVNSSNQNRNDTISNDDGKHIAVNVSDISVDIDKGKLAGATAASATDHFVNEMSIEDDARNNSQQHNDEEQVNGGDYNKTLTEKVRDGEELSSSKFHSLPDLQEANEQNTDAAQKRTSTATTSSTATGRSVGATTTAVNAIKDFTMASVVLTRRTEEAIRTIYINDLDNVLYATSGDICVLWWDLENLVPDRPITKGAAHSRIPLMVKHTMECAKTLVVQHEREIIWLTEGQTRTLVMILPEDMKADKARMNKASANDGDNEAEHRVSDVEEISASVSGIKEPEMIQRSESMEKIIVGSRQKRVSFPVPVGSIPYYFNGRVLVLCLSDKKYSGWDIDILNWVDRSKINRVRIEKSQSSTFHPWGFNCVDHGKYLIGVLAGNIVCVWEVVSGRLIHQFKNWHDSEIVALHVEDYKLSKDTELKDSNASTSSIEPGYIKTFTIYTLSRTGKVVIWTTSTFAPGRQSRNTIRKYALPRIHSQFSLGLAVSSYFSFSLYTFWIG